MRRLPMVLATLLLLALVPPASGAGDDLAAGWRESLVITSDSAGAAKMF